jgi:O-antigen ligase
VKVPDKLFGQHFLGESTPRPSPLIFGALCLYAATLFVFPSDLVIKIVGGQGFFAGLVALFLFVGWLVTRGRGRVDRPLLRPTHAVVACFAFMSLLSWAMTPFHGLSTAQQLSADRWIMLVAASAGVALISAETLRTVDALAYLLRIAVWGAAFCGFVAALQWWFSIDLTPTIRALLPGFSGESLYNTYQARGALQRVTGTALHPIELGVVAGMMLPVAIALAWQGKGSHVLWRWTPAVVISLAIPASVSRSAIVSVLASLVIFALLLPAKPRLTVLSLLPLGVVAVFAVRPGYLRTMASFVSAGGEDPSVATRLGDYPLVERLVSERPWFGTGGGTYMPDNAIDILDNQYLKGAIDFGLVGITGMLAWLLIPPAIGWAACRMTDDGRLRPLTASLTGAAVASAACSFTFDSLSFNMFAGLHALVVGCIGACWYLARIGSVASADYPTYQQGG